MLEWQWREDNEWGGGGRQQGEGAQFTKLHGGCLPNEARRSTQCQSGNAKTNASPDHPARPLNKVSKVGGGGRRNDFTT